MSTDAADVERRIRELLADVYTPEGVEIWLNAGNLNLHGLQPIVAAAPSMERGQFAVIAHGVSTSEWWNTGRTYASAPTAFARQTREFNALRCNAYVVKRHSAGYTVYLAPSTVLGTVSATAGAQ